jgi:hypothetical protein
VLATLTALAIDRIRSHDVVIDREEAADGHAVELVTTVDAFEATAVGLVDSLDGEASVGLADPLDGEASVGEV